MPITSRHTTEDATVTGDSLREPLDSLSAELGRISEEIQSINSGFQAQIQESLLGAQVRLCRKFEKISKPH